MCIHPLDERILMGNTGSLTKQQIGCPSQTKSSAEISDVVRLNTIMLKQRNNAIVDEV